jgi:hypothetical protein
MDVGLWGTVHVFCWTWVWKALYTCSAEHES